MRTHGKHSTYVAGCRCDACRAAHNEQARMDGSNVRVGARAESKRRWDKEHNPLCACGQPMKRGALQCASCRAWESAEVNAQILDLRDDGYLNVEIALILGISPAAVAMRCQRLRRLGLDVAPLPLGRLPINRDRVKA